MFAHFILHAFFLRNSCYSLITSGVRLFMALPMEVCFLWWYFFNLHNILWEKKVPLRRDASGTGGRRAGCLHLKQSCCACQPCVFRDGGSGSRLRQTCFSVASIVQDVWVVCLKPGCRRPDVVKCSSLLIHHPLEAVSVPHGSTLGWDVYSSSTRMQTDCQTPFLQHHFVCYYNTRV